MDRRHFLKGFGAGAVSLGFPATTSPVWLVPISATTKNSGLSGSRRGARCCKIIGIGGTGCNFVLAFSRSSAVAETKELMPELICIDLGRENLKYLEAASKTEPGWSPIKCLSLAPLGAGGRVNYARSAALRKREALRVMLADADVVFLVAGLGGGTGGGVTPIMARLAREAGALTVAAVVTPFEYEGERIRKANTTIGYLNREADLVVRFSNEELARALSGDTFMEDFFNSQDQRVAACIRGLIDKAIGA